MLCVAIVVTAVTGVLLSFVGGIPIAFFHSGNVVEIVAGELSLRRSGSSIGEDDTEWPFPHRSIWEPIVVVDIATNDNLLLHSPQLVFIQFLHGNSDLPRAPWSYRFHSATAPMALGSVYQAFGLKRVPNVGGRPMIGCASDARRDMAAVNQVELNNLFVFVHGHGAIDNIGAFRSSEGIFGGIGGTRGRIGGLLIGSSLVRSSVRQILSFVSLPPGVVGEPTHLINLPLHFAEGLLQLFVISIQRFAGQAVSPSYLNPLQTGKHRVNDQDEQSKYLKAKFGVFAPAIVVFFGWVVCAWGWWRLKTLANGRQFFYGLSDLIGGFALSCCSLGVLLIIVS